MLRKKHNMAHIIKLLIPVLLVQAALAVTAQQHQTMKTGSAAPGRALDPCITAPTAPECSQFTYPQASAAADIGSLCKGMHFMASCSVAKACNASGAGPDGNPRGPGAAEVSRNNPDICDPFQHVTTVCKLDTGMGRMSGEQKQQQAQILHMGPAQDVLSLWLCWQQVHVAFVLATAVVSPCSALRKPTTASTPARTSTVLR